MEIAIAHSMAFVEEWLEPCRLLEIGCGDGRLAAVLAARGYDVVGIDVDPQAVAAARARGIETRQADVTQLEVSQLGVPPPEAALFSRSLHHVGDPRLALVRVAELLPAGGALLIDDFAFDLADERAAAWRYDGEALLRRWSPAAVAPPPFATDPLELWRRDHPDHHLHGSKTLRAAVSEVFPGARELAAPYLFRYLVEALPGGDEGARVGSALLAWEETKIARGELPAIGRRWVWRSQVSE